MTIAACMNCGAKADVRCVDDHCSEREDRDTAFLCTVGQSWQFEANALLDEWVAAKIEMTRLELQRSDLEYAIDRAREAESIAKSRFDQAMRDQMKLRVGAAAAAAEAA